MAFDIGEDSNGAMVSMNLVPLIDVMLILLILFIVTMPLQTHAVKIDMPSPDGGSHAQTAIDLEIDFDGTVLWNGYAVPNRTTLQAFFQGIGNQARQPDFHIRPNRLAPYETVAHVLSDAQRLGVRQIGFVGIGAYAD